MSKLLVLVSFCLFLFITVANAAHSKRRVVVKRAKDSPEYDRSVTTFDPTGRLLQVEYALEAVNKHGKSIAALMMPSCDNDTPTGVILVTPASSSIIYRLDDHIWMCATGLAGDARYLASLLRSFALNHRLETGEAVTVEEVAQHAALLQHSLTKMAGRRPLACTAMLVGLTRGKEWELFRSDPGSILEDCLYCAAGKSQDEILKRMDEMYNSVSAAAATGSSSNLGGAACDLLEIVQSQQDEEERYLTNAQAYTVWTFEKDATRRGNMRVICYHDIEKKEDLMSNLMLTEESTREK